MCLLTPGTKTFMVVLHPCDTKRMHLRGSFRAWAFQGAPSRYIEYFAQVHGIVVLRYTTERTSQIATLTTRLPAFSMEANLKSCSHLFIINESRSRVYCQAGLPVWQNFCQIDLFWQIWKTLRVILFNSWSIFITILKVIEIDGGGKA